MRYADQPLSSLAIAIPMATEIFRKNRLDFCCGGKQTLKEACEKRNLKLDKVIEQLEKLENKEEIKIEERSLFEITNFIQERYHADLRRRLPELLALAKKVEKVHAEHLNCPTGLHALLTDLHNEMLMHMMKEEIVLFPMINQGRGNLALLPIKIMTDEHDIHGRQLDKIHRLTNDFNPPDGACGTWCALYSGLEKFEKELMEHIHLENNILFPRALGQNGA